MKAIIKWTNKYSNESGYVADVSAKEKCFHNTFEKGGAKLYASESSAKKVIATLEKYGEGENNNFEVVAV